MSFGRVRLLTTQYRAVRLRQKRPRCPMEEPGHAGWLHGVVSVRHVCPAPNPQLGAVASLLQCGCHGPSITVPHTHTQTGRKADETGTHTRESHRPQQGFLGPSTRTGRLPSGHTVGPGASGEGVGCPEQPDVPRPGWSPGPLTLPVPPLGTWGWLVLPPWRLNVAVWLLSRATRVTPRSSIKG